MFRGERFEVDLGDESEGGDAAQQTSVLPGAFVNDVLERKPTAPKPPTAPTLKSKTGFPEHAAGKQKAESRFKQRLSGRQSSRANVVGAGAGDSRLENASRVQPAAGGKAPSTWEEEERARIDRENNDRLAEMSSAEIEQERRELMNSLSPEMIQKLLQRSSIESGSGEADLSKHREPVPGSSMKRHDGGASATKPRPEKKVAFEEPALESGDADDEVVEPEDVDTEQPPTAQPLPSDDSIHFPRPAQPPDLDPSSTTFLADLHTKYFPSLPADPSKLAWMQDPSTTTKSTYDPKAPGIEPQHLRFSFRGALIPPSAASAIPVTRGLHHHGDAPEAAGYTIPELAHLGRSAYAAQRCIAFQTLGRILFRLGSGEFGDPEQGVGVVGAEQGLGALARGLWRVMEVEKVTEMLVRESEGRGVDGGRHVSAKAYATEAAWLWQRGGGRKVGAE